jgi:hypothetical protein
MGLAWLTKTPAALLVPIGGVLVAAQMVARLAPASSHAAV